jgi:hypothetical protein
MKPVTLMVFGLDGDTWIILAERPCPASKHATINAAAIH